ncbi:hypothetical protein K474DRAFT_1711611 [Panus rudis PR-1116 ss-1]|nr:hypothetical protein K474DRAFT_1711611 [Panus rudis PR-1116 ss-1]
MAPVYSTLFDPSYLVFDTETYRPRLELIIFHDHMTNPFTHYRRPEDHIITTFRGVGRRAYYRINPTVTQTLWEALHYFDARIRLASHGRRLPPTLRHQGGDLFAVPLQFDPRILQQTSLSPPPVFSLLQELGNRNTLAESLPLDDLRRLWDRYIQAGRDTIAWIREANTLTNRSQGAVQWLWTRHHRIARERWLRAQEERRLIPHPLFTNADAGAVVPYSPLNPYLPQQSRSEDDNQDPDGGDDKNSNRALILHPIWSSTAQNALTRVEPEQAGHDDVDESEDLSRALIPHPVLRPGAPNALVPRGYFTHHQFPTLTTGNSDQNATTLADADTTMTETSDSVTEASTNGESTYVTASEGNNSDESETMVEDSDMDNTGEEDEVMYILEEDGDQATDSDSDEAMA